MSTIPNPTQAVIELLNQLAVNLEGRISDARIRRTKAIPSARDYLDGMIAAYAEEVRGLKKVTKDIATGNHPHRQDSTRPLWLIDPLGRNNPEEND